MTLSENDLRNRRFFLATYNQFVKFLIGKIEELKKSLQGVDASLKKTFSVKVVNKSDYSKELSQLHDSVRQLNSQLIQTKKAGDKRLLEKIQQINKSLTKIKLPDLNVQPVVSSLEKLKFPQTDTQSITQAIEILTDQVRALPQKMPVPPKISFPKIPPAEKVYFPSKMSWAETPEFLKALETLQKEVRDMPLSIPKNKSKIDLQPVIDSIQELKTTIENIPQQTIEFPDQIAVSNFPPQKHPLPVTHMSINALAGYVHTTATTVGTTLTKLPSYGVLDNRRALLIYNNSSSTIYVGGSTVTTDTGMPVPANSYSPILDAGERMIVYGISDTNSLDCRVMEISDIAAGR